MGKEYDNRQDKPLREQYWVERVEPVFRDTLERMNVSVGPMPWSGGQSL